MSKKQNAVIAYAHVHKAYCPASLVKEKIIVTYSLLPEIDPVHMLFVEFPYEAIKHFDSENLKLLGDMCLELMEFRSKEFCQRVDLNFESRSSKIILHSINQQIKQILEEEYKK